EPQPQAGVGETQCRQSQLWRDAAAIDGVTCLVDSTAIASRIFGARTSGQVFLYDQNGALRFSGGITPSRDHRGNNAGIDAITGFLDTGTLTTSTAPV